MFITPSGLGGSCVKKEEGVNPLKHKDMVFVRSDILPDPDLVYPIPGVLRVCFLKNIIQNPRIQVGDYTYYDDPQDVGNFEKNVLYHFDFIGDILIIGKFCQIAFGVTFIMNGALHGLDGFSTYPFKSWVGLGQMHLCCPILKETQWWEMTFGLDMMSPFYPVFISAMGPLLRPKVW